MKNIRLFSILASIILLISVLLTTNVYAHSVELDPDSLITFPWIISKPEGTITIKSTETGYSLDYQAVEVSDNIASEITNVENEGKEELESIKKEIDDLEKAYKEYYPIYDEATKKYEDMLKDESATEEELAKAKEEYEKALDNYKAKVKEYNSKVDEYEEKSEEINDKKQELIPSYVEGNWVEAEENKFKVDVSKFSGNKMFVIWVKLVSSDGTISYDCQNYVFSGNKIEEIKVTSVSLDKEKISIQKDEEIELKATINPSEATDKTLTWESSDEKIAKVEDGKVTGISEGKVTITVTTKDGNYTDTCEVTVTSKIVEEDKEQDKEENKEDTNTQVKDPTIAGGKIPQTGVFSYVTIIAIVLISAIGIVTYIRNKDLKLK